MAEKIHCHSAFSNTLKNKRTHFGCRRPQNTYETFFKRLFQSTDVNLYLYSTADDQDSVVCKLLNAALTFLSFRVVKLI